MAKRLSAQPATPNPNGSLDQLFLLTGDPITSPIDGIDGLNGVQVLPTGSRRRLRLFHFNDLHNYLSVAERDGGTSQLFAQIVRHYRRSRAAASADDIVLLFSGGDDHTGHVLDELLGWRPEELVTDPAYVAYAAAGVDAATLGNHELDRGGALLAKAIREHATFPILSANIYGSRHIMPSQDYFPAALAIANGLRIGLLGLTTMVDTRTHTSIDPDLSVASPLAVLSNLLPALARQADLIILMSHCGYGDATNQDGKAGAGRHLAEGDIALARRAAQLTDKPIVIMGGHTHSILNEQGLGPDTLVDDVPILQAGGHGSHLGEFEITVTVGGPGRGAARRAGLHRLKRHGAADPDLRQRADDADQAFEAEILAPLLAGIASKMTETLAQNDAGTPVSPEVTWQQRYMGECALANFICDALVTRSGEFSESPVDLALVNATAIGDGLAPDRPVSFKDWYGVMPFPDCVMIGTLTGRTLRDIIANNAPRIVRPDEMTGDRPPNLRAYVSRGLLHGSAAIRYEIRLGTAAPAARATNIIVDGVPLDEQLDRVLRVAYTTYLGAGGFGEAWNGMPIGAGVPGQIPSFDMRQVPAIDTGLVLRNEIIAYLRAVGRVSPATGAKLDQRLAVIS